MSFFFGDNIATFPANKHMFNYIEANSIVIAIRAMPNNITKMFQFDIIYIHCEPPARFGIIVNMELAIPSTVSPDFKPCLSTHDLGKVIARLLPTGTIL